jgi:hypothetical protein
LMNIGHEIGDEVSVKPELFQRAVAELYSRKWRQDLAFQRELGMGKCSGVGWTTPGPAGKLSQIWED